jgi:hypothetical protein
MDANTLAKSIVDQATGDELAIPSTKSLAASTLGRLGGLKGGKARADKLTAEQRKAIAKKAADSRWSNLHSGK